MPISRLSLIIIVTLLAGYALFDKGFAYVGYPPIFIGEIALGACLFLAVTGAFSFRVFRSPIAWVLILFGFWQFVRTVPYLGGGGLDAIRDSASYYYALFGILFAAAILRGRAVEWVATAYGKWVPWFLLLSVPAIILTTKFRFLIPTHPGGDMPILWLKPGDMAVHLAGIAVFMILGLHLYYPRREKARLVLQEIIFVILLSIDVIVAGSRNRGGFLAVVLACFVVSVFKPMNRLTRFVLPALFVIVVVGSLDISIPVTGGRAVSIKQITDNIHSIFFESDREELSDTSEWRLKWWSIISDETFDGKFFWTGRGYGANLAEKHGFTDATGNRSPHNAHLTFLSRSGVPGLVLWIGLQCTIVACLLLSYYRSTQIGAEPIANLNLWVMGYLVASLVNSSFDVYLEGPQGGIWYWCIVGFAIALTEEQRLLRPYAQPSFAASQRSGAVV